MSTFLIASAIYGKVKIAKSFVYFSISHAKSYANCYLSSMIITVSLHPFLLRTRSPHVICCRHSGHRPLIGKYCPHSRKLLAKQVKWHTKRQLGFVHNVFGDFSSLRARKQISQIADVCVSGFTTADSGSFRLERRIMWPRQIFMWSGSGLVTWNECSSIKYESISEWIVNEMSC